MQNKELENQIDFLFSAALKRCGNLHVAEDLTQETLLCALAYTAKGNCIEDMRAWLLTVLNHKWNDQLRRKYAVLVQDHSARDRKRTVQPARKDRTAVNLGVELNVLLANGCFRIWLQLEHR